ncbi:MAG: ELWxxDGT repeat protein [Pirellulales bacterium]
MGRPSHDWLPRRGKPRPRALYVETLETRCLLDGGSAQLKDINTVGQGADVHGITPIGDQVFFTAWTVTSGYELWRSDGQPSGTRLVKEMQPGISGLTPAWTSSVAGDLLFMGELGAFELWRSDGTEEGTTLLHAFSEFSFPSPEKVHASLGSRVLFAANDGVHGQELWVTDGTESGTTLLSDIFPGETGSEPRDLTTFGDAVYFVATSAEHGRELWRSDGTVAGTRLVQDVDLGESSSNPYYLTATDSSLYFLVHRNEWWRVAEEGGGAMLVASVGQSETAHVWTACAVLSTLYFTAETPETGTELWVLDPSGASHVLSDIGPGPDGSLPQSLTRVGSRLAFTADDGVVGRELWITDGTESGTRLVADIRSGPSGSSPDYFAAFGNELIFRADDGVHGIEPWLTDGTALGARLLADIFPGDNGSSLPRPSSLILTEGTRTSYAIAAQGTRAYFVASDPANGPELRWTDGHQVYLVQDIMPGTAGGAGSEYIEYHGQAYFFANDGFHGYELWRSDGTEAGTFMVKDLIPGAVGAVPREFVVHRDRLYFWTEDGDDAFVVWQSDGTSAGTEPLGRFQRAGYPLLKSTTEALFLGFPTRRGALELWSLKDQSRFELVVSLVAESQSSWDFGFLGMAANGGELLFLTEEWGYGTDLWITNGTPQGTRRLQRFDSDDGPGLYDSAILGGRLYFSGYDAEHGWELWSTDGTPEGTRIVEDIRPGPSDSRPTTLRALGDRLLFFATESANPRGLFARMNGPNAQAERIVDFAPGMNTYWSRIVARGEYAFLIMRSTRDDMQFWRSDGTTAGTTLLEDLPALPSASDWSAIVEYGDVVLVGLNLTHVGMQWWRSDGTPAGTQLYEALPTTYIGFPQLIGNTIYFSAGEPWTLRPATGDANFDRRVDLDDFGALKAAFGQAGGALPADFNQDGRVDLGDFGLFKAAFAAAGAPPGPENPETSGAAALDAAIREIAEEAEEGREKNWALPIARIGPWTPLSHADPSRRPTALPTTVTPSSRLR